MPKALVVLELPLFSSVAYAAGFVHAASVYSRFPSPSVILQTTVDQWTQPSALFVPCRNTCRLLKNELTLPALWPEVVSVPKGMPVKPCRSYSAAPSGTYTPMDADALRPPVRMISLLSKPR